jgi:DNA mismatch repair protein MSH5
MNLSFSSQHPISTDGAGLFCGVLQHLLHRGSQCPKVLVATHFHDIFSRDIFDPDSLPITFCHMQVMFTAVAPSTIDGSGFERLSEVGGPSKEKITYLYRWAP